MKNRDFVARQKAGIRVTLRTGGGLIFFGDSRSWIAGSLYPMDLTVTRETVWRVRVSGLYCAPVNTSRKLLKFLHVTFRALPREQLCCGAHFMDVAVTGRTSRLAQDRVDTFAGVRGLFRVTRFAPHFRNFRRVRELLDRRVAISAAQNSMRACSMLPGADGNVFSFFGFHPWLAMAGEAGFILFQRLRRLFLLACQTGKMTNASNNNAEATLQRIEGFECW